MDELDKIKIEQSKRIELVRVENGLTQVAFSKLIGIQQGSYSDIKRGKAGLSSNVLNKLKELFGISSTWLLTGNGEKYIDSKKETHDSEINNNIEYNRKNNLRNKRQFSLLDKLLTELSSKNTEIQELKETIKSREEMIKSKDNTIQRQLSIIEELLSKANTKSKTA